MNEQEVVDRWNTINNKGRGIEEIFMRKEADDMNIDDGDLDGIQCSLRKNKSVDFIIYSEHCCNVDEMSTGHFNINYCMCYNGSKEFKKFLKDCDLRFDFYNEYFVFIWRIKNDNPNR